MRVLVLALILLAGCTDLELSDLSLQSSDLPDDYELIETERAEALRSLIGTDSNPGGGDPILLEAGNITPIAVRGAVWGPNGSSNWVYSLAIEFDSESALRKWVVAADGICDGIAMHRANLLALVFSFDNDEIAQQAGHQLRDRTGAHELCSAGPWF